MNLKAIGQKLVLVLFGLMLAVIFLEGMFHFYPDLIPPSDRVWIRVHGPSRLEQVHFIENETRYIHPNVNVTWYVEDKGFEINTINIGFGRFGFRDNGFEEAVYAASVGDSFTFGFGVNAEDTFTELLEQRIRKPVVNMGTNWYSSIANRRMIQDFGVKLKPKVVLWNLCKNDHRDNFFHGYEATGLKKIVNLINSNSVVSQLLFNHIYAPLKANKKTIIVNKPVKLTSYYVELIDHVNMSNARVQEGFAITKQELLTAKKICEENSVRLVVTIIPWKEEVYWPLFTEALPELSSFDIEEHDRLLEAFLEENGFDYINLKQGLVAAAQNNEQVYFNIDGHTNERGHQIIAEQIYEFLELEELL